MEAGHPFDPGRRASKVDVIVFFFLGEAFAKAPLFFLPLVKKVQIEANAKALCEVGVGDHRVRVHHINPGIVISPLKRILLIVRDLVDEDGRQPDDIRPEVNIITIIFVQHPCDNPGGIGKVTGGREDQRISRARFNAIVSAEVRSICRPLRSVDHGDGRKNFCGLLTFDTALQRLLLCGGGKR